MRWFSVILALMVSGIIYLLVMNRQALFEFTGRSAETEVIASTEADAPLLPVAREGTVSVVAMTSTAQQIDSAVLVRGRTEAARQVVVKAETSGLILSEPLRKGTIVEAGQTLCKLDPGTRDAQLSQARASLAEASAGIPVSQARLLEAEAALSEAQINDRAASKLIEGGFASETRLAATRSAVTSAQANLEAARSGLEAAHASVEAAQASVAVVEKDIDRLTLVAPFGGLLETDTAELGALMQSGSDCATVIQLAPMKLVGFVSETQIERVEPDAMAQARLVSGRQVAGKVSFLSRSADPQTRTFRVEVEVPNADLSLRDGQTVEIAIAADGETAHLVPASALTLDDSGQLGLRIVEKDDDGQDIACFVPVKLLRDTLDGVFVSGLPETARIIIVGQEYVTDGVPVDVTLASEEVSQ
ncbi:efflux RND transporter periplasmic adaptor subunit [Tropicimonas sp. IMCC34043]|uniref:efflux RND transporter periplasmic adaptor subunit n=1 Tax=Tropicimonas sp. IMCC34043 TaxID=2248760 RepID=UPI000E228EF6|nr:efflux RND transporter periplasmic adaptor subunit [Tropicimonas sp. IMCC34043]